MRSDRVLPDFFCAALSHVGNGIKKVMSVRKEKRNKL